MAKAKKKKGWITIKIMSEHYSLVSNNKQKTGVNIGVFIGQAIVEKLKKQNNLNQ